MMTRWHRLIDAKGVKRKVCFIPQAKKISGLTRKELLRPSEAESFWKMFFVSGIVLSLFMILGLLITNGVVALLTQKGPFQFSIFQGIGPAIVSASSVAFLFYGTIVGLMWNRCMWRSSEHAIVAMTRSGLCPSCAYGIGGIPSESDGCVVCPECSAAWRMTNEDRG